MIFTTPTLPAQIVPGTHVILFGAWEDGIVLRRSGLELRDTILVYGPGLESRLAFLFRVPVETTTVAEQVLKTGTGALNIDLCRVSTTPVDAKAMERCNTPGSGRMFDSSSPIGTFTRSSSSGALDTTRGRWPSNLIFVHSVGCTRAGTKMVRTGVGPTTRGTSPTTKDIYGTYAQRSLVHHGGPDGTEAVEDWVCVEDCPVRALDSQAGDRPGMPLQTKRKGDSPKGYGMGVMPDPSSPGFGDSGGASRFFPQFENEEAMLTWLKTLIGES